MKKLIVVMSLILLFVSTAKANELSFYGGKAFSNYSMSTNGFSDSVNASKGSFGGQFLLSANDVLSVGLDLSHTNLGSDNVYLQTPVPVTNYALSENTTVGLLVMKLAVPKEEMLLGIFKPYMFGGVGMHSTQMKVNATLPNGYLFASNFNQSESLVNNTVTGFAASAGVGVDVPLYDVFFVGLETRYTYLDRVNLTSTNYTALTNSSDMIQVLGKVGMKF